MPNKIISKGYEAIESKTYSTCRKIVIDSRNRIYIAVNSAMVEAYWNIGKAIYEACGKSDRATYGEKLLDDISSKLTKEFGKGFDVTNL